MSFGEGNLHEKVDMYRRQLGGSQAANNRLKGANRELRHENGRLRVLAQQLAEIASLHVELPDWVADEMAALGVGGGAR